MIGFVAPNDGALDAKASANASSIFRHGGRNLGNLAFWYATRRLFSDPVVHLDWSTRPANLKTKPRLIVVPAANFIGAHTQLGQLAELLRQFDLPCVVVGLGAQSERDAAMPPIPPGTLEFLQEASQRTPFIAVRGPFSKAVCEHAGVTNVEAVGCPSLLINPDRDLGSILEDRIARLEPRTVGVAAASTKGNTQSVERELWRWMRLFPGSQYIMQRPAEVFSAILNEPETEQSRAHLDDLARYLGVAGGADVMAAELRQFGYVPVSIDSWRVHVRRFSCTVNTRIHGTMVALQSGVPSLCVAHDARTEELCRQMRLPWIPVQKFVELRYDIKAMFKAAAFDGAAFEAYRRVAAERYATLFEKAGLTPSAHLGAFLDKPVRAAA